MKERIEYLCPQCFKIHKRILVWRNDYGSDLYEDGTVIKNEEIETEVIRIDFPCKHTTESYGVEDIEVYIDEENKTIRILNEFEEDKKEIKKANPEYKKYKLVFE